MLRAIIVDDEPATATIIEYFVEQGALPVRIVGTANNGFAALDLIRKARPRLVFLDITMPLMDGFEVIEKAREMTDDDIQFIIITGYDLFEYAQSALRLGARDILLKPLELEQLKKSVTGLLGYNSTPNETVNSVLAYLHGHYYEDISLNGIADDLHISPQYLSRLFKKYTGATLNKYLNRIRIEQAKELLLSNKNSIRDIAEMVGYQSLNNFYQHFQEITGETPKAFKEQRMKDRMR